MTTHEQVIIVGAGHAAGELATSLRNHGWEGGIIMIGDEPHIPYQRPPLSKGYLSGEIQTEALYLKPRSTYDEAGIELLLGVSVQNIDCAAKRVTLSDGRVLDYSKLALTTGGRPRRLQVKGADLAEKTENFHYLRTIADVKRIHSQMKPGLRLVIVGGGYVGLEVAAVATKIGMHVTVLETAPRVLARVTAPEISAFYERVHREAGVTIHTGVEVQALEVDNSQDAVTAVLCSGGFRVEADVVIAGIGLIPNTELAQAAGLAVDNGIEVDEYACTADESIVAAGDCTSHPNAKLGRRLRLESVPNAVEQARTAAASICGKQEAYNAVPWFWSDQYDLKLKMVGLSAGFDQLVVRGSTKTRSFSAFYMKEGVMIAADTVSRPAEFMIAKRLISDRVPLSAELLADERLNLKELLPA